MAVETSVLVRIRAIDEATRTIRAVDRAMRGMNRAGIATHPGQRGPGGGIMPTLNQRAAQIHAAGARASNAMMAPLGITPGMIGAAGVAAAAKQTIQETANFEEQMSEIRKRGGFSAEQTEEIRRGILDLATSGKVISTVEDIAAGYERAAAAGIAMKDLPGFVEQSAKMADAFKMDAEAAANAISFMSKNMNLDHSGISEMLDLINALGDAGTADEADIVGFLNRAGAPLMQRGFDPQHIAAIGATMLNLGMEWETSSRAINTTTQRLLSPASKQATVAMQKLFGGKKGYADFRKRFSKNAMAGLNEFMDKVGSLDNLDQLDVIGDVVGTEFGPVIQRLIAARAELQRNLDLQANKDSWFGGLDKSYDLKKSNFWSQWQLLKNEIASITLDLGNGGLPLLKDGLVWMRATINEIDEGLKQFKTEIDMEAFKNAQQAVRDLAGLISQVMSMGAAEGTPILNFFDRLAALVNTISNGIGTIDAFVKWATGQELKPGEGPADYAREALREGAKISPPLAVIEDGLETGQRWSRDPGANAGADYARERAAAEFFAGPPDMNGPSPDELGIPDQREVEYLKQELSALSRRLNQPMPSVMDGVAPAIAALEEPLSTSATIDSAGFLAGLRAMEGEAAATVSRINQTLSGIRAPNIGVGGGNNYRQNRNSQFAPVTPGGGI